jgi:hypothetical protein
MARMLAEFKEPEDAREQNQRQTPVPPVERSRPPEPRAAQDGEDFSDCERCPTMSVVVATDFGPRDAISPRRGRTVRTLAISRSEVTVAEWNACVRDGACSGLRDGSNNRPVLDVSRSDAVAYADWLSRKTGRFYRPMKSGGWARSNSGNSRQGDEDEPFSRGPARGGDQSGFRVARTVDPVD